MAGIFEWDDAHRPKVCRPDPGLIRGEFTAVSGAAQDHTLVYRIGGEEICRITVPHSESTVDVEGRHVRDTDVYRITVEVDGFAGIPLMRCLKKAED